MLLFYDLLPKASTYLANVSATTVLRVPNALHAGPRLQTAVLIGQMRAFAGGVLEYIRQHLTVEPAVNVQRTLENHRGVPVPREIRVNTRRNVQRVPGVAENVVREQLGAVALRAVTFRRVVVSVPAENEHETRVNESGRVEKPRRGRVGQKRPNVRLRIVRVQVFAQDLRRFALGNNPAVNVNFGLQRIVTSRVSVAAFNRIASSINNSPFARTEVILLDHVQIPQYRRVPEDYHHSVGLFVARVGDQGGRVAGRFERAAQRVVRVAELGFDRHVLPGFRAYVERPQFGGGAAVARHAPVQEDFVAVQDRGVGVARGRAVFVVGGLPDVA